MQSEEKVALQEAFRLLAGRDYFPLELRKKLLLMKLSEKAVAFALRKCRELGYLDEQKVTENYIASLKRKGKGPLFIAKKLKEKISDLPVLSHDPKTEQEEIKALLVKRSLNSHKERERAIRFLLARGFHLEEIIRSLKDLDKSTCI